MKRKQTRTRRESAASRPSSQVPVAPVPSPAVPTPPKSKRQLKAPKKSGAGRPGRQPKAGFAVAPMGPERAKDSYAGCGVQRNQWIGVGITVSQARQLKAFARSQMRPKCQTLAHGFRFLATAALAHLDVLLPLLEADRRYLDSEGFLVADDHMCRDLLHGHAYDNFYAARAEQLLAGVTAQAAKGGAK